LAEILRSALGRWLLAPAGNFSLQSASNYESGLGASAGANQEPQSARGRLWLVARSRSSLYSSHSRFVGQAGRRRASKPPTPDSLEARVEAYVEPYVRSNNFSGVVLLAREGKVVLRKGYGMANYELGVPNTPESKFHIASVSKSFTAAALLLLEQQGKLSVNDPLSKFIPDYPNGDRITIHHLLAHTSGIPDVNRLPGYEEKSRPPSDWRTSSAGSRISLSNSSRGRASPTATRTTTSWPTSSKRRRGKATAIFCANTCSPPCE